MASSTSRTARHTAPGEPPAGRSTLPQTRRFAPSSLHVATATRTEQREHQTANRRAPKLGAKVRAAARPELEDQRRTAMSCCALSKSVPPAFVASCDGWSAAIIAPSRPCRRPPTARRCHYPALWRAPGSARPPLRAPRVDTPPASIGDASQGWAADGAPHVSCLEPPCSKEWVSLDGFVGRVADGGSLGSTQDMPLAGLLSVVAWQAGARQEPQPHSSFR